jgi:hypothetical protein
VLQVADAASDNDKVQRELDFDPDLALAKQLRVIGRPDGVPHWLVFGDSHAGALAEAFSLFLKRRGETGLVAYHSGCMPVVDTGDGTCRRFTRAIGRYVREHRAIGNVVLVSIWRQPLEAAAAHSSAPGVDDSEAIMRFNAGFHTTLDGFAKTGARVFVWEPLPSMPASVPEAMSRNMVFGEYWPTSRPYSDHRSEFAFFARALAREGALIAGHMHGDTVLCAGGTCRASLHGRPLFIDNNHPTLGSSPLYASALLEQLDGEPKATARP